MSSSRYRSSRRPCDCDGGFFSNQCCGDESSFRCFMLVFIPLSLGALNLLAGANKISIFKLDTGVVTYLIAAQGYKVRGQPWTKARYVYPAPDDWPKAIWDLPLWLLFHLILGILLGVYIVFLALTYFTDRRMWRSWAILQPRWWSRMISFILAGLCVALSSRDAAFWAQGAQVSSFSADILGGVIVVVGILFGIWWLLLLKPWAVCSDTYSTTHYSSSRTGGYSSSRKPGYSSRSGRSGRSHRARR